MKEAKADDLQVEMKDENTKCELHSIELVTFCGYEKRGDCQKMASKDKGAKLEIGSTSAVRARLKEGEQTKTRQSETKAQ